MMLCLQNCIKREKIKKVAQALTNILCKCAKIAHLLEARKHVHGETQERNSDGTFQLRKNCADGNRDRSGRTTREIANK